MSNDIVLTIKLRDWTIVACLDFIKNPTSGADAAQRSLEAFILAMQAQGKIPKRSQEEIDEVMLNLSVESEMDLTGIENYVDQAREEQRAARVSELAAQASAEIERAATPQVGKTVTLNEDSPQVSRPTTTISLFKQPRRAFSDLKKESPKDRFIEAAVALKPEEHYPDRLEIAALEIAYSNLPKDLWGTDQAKDEIQKMINLHNGERA